MGGIEAKPLGCQVDESPWARVNVDLSSFQAQPDSARSPDLLEDHDPRASRAQKDDL
jgi:hypothetical protein